jgi:hypothetical protein
MSIKISPFFSAMLIISSSLATAALAQNYDAEPYQPSSSGAQPVETQPVETNTITTKPLVAPVIADDDPNREIVIDENGAQQIPEQVPKQVPLKEPIAGNPTEYQVIEQEEPKPRFKQKSSKKAIVRVLNKVTARSQDVEVPIGIATTPKGSSNLEIIARACHKSNPDEYPDSASLIEIYEVKGKSNPVKVFDGWMFQSSPSLSSMEHPVYDVVIVGCE